ncbi:hypothetical protein [Polyangium spumosum]|uniref:Uncharacterized protein n=1 Tax=Polyangium spumosum TaxID=889282 RepID=A0A6N7Q0M5_9BACT|nr:hypothetical protein [Polyangium spumosum]MRG97803.1 hypothetical protein [Polyangium spumosum]
MKVYRVIKLDKMGRLSRDDDTGRAAPPIEVCLKHKHKLKWKPRKMLKKLWGAWL